MLLKFKIVEEIYECTVVSNHSCWIINLKMPQNASKCWQPCLSPPNEMLIIYCDLSGLFHVELSLIFHVLPPPPKKDKNKKKNIPPVSGFPNDPHIQLINLRIFSQYLVAFASWYNLSERRTALNITEDKWVVKKKEIRKKISEVIRDSLVVKISDLGCFSSNLHAEIYSYKNRFPNYGPRYYNMLWRVVI